MPMEIVYREARADELGHLTKEPLPRTSPETGPKETFI